MNITTFLTLLSAFSAVSSLITEGIKNLVTDKSNLPYNIIALAASLIVGGGGTAVYYRLSSIPFTADSITHILLMGLAGGLVSMVGFDKIQQTIRQFTEKENRTDNRR